MAKILRRLDAQVSDDQFEVVRDLARRLELFGYTRDEVIEHALYHGSKVMERVVIGHEAEAERAKRVAEKITANAARR